MKKDLQQLKREQQRRFVASKKAQGWKTLTVLLPPEVLSKLLDHKRLLMTAYRANQIA